MVSERKTLFRREVLHPHVSKFPLPSRADAFRPKLASWAKLIASGKADQRTESELLPLFFADFFSQLLGYTGPADGQSRYTMTLQRTIDDDGGRPDGVLGEFNGQPRPVVSVEGKGTKGPLDRPYGGRRLSAVQQGYQYAINLRCDWVLVTSMRETRLYCKSADQRTYELFDIEALDQNDFLFRQFVFDQLFGEYQVSIEHLNELRGHRSLLDVDKRILENNLYGVDINHEAVEICRLSLWIKTAHPGRQLTSLDHSIRVGNSVVDDATVDPAAFDWRRHFPEVFQAGGFDVVIANPPYIRQEWLARFKPHWEQRFRSYSGTADILTYFFELGVDLLREGGILPWGHGRSPLPTGSANTRRSPNR